MEHKPCQFLDLRVALIYHFGTCFKIPSQETIITMIQSFSFMHSSSRPCVFLQEMRPSSFQCLEFNNLFFFFQHARLLLLKPDKTIFYVLHFQSYLETQGFIRLTTRSMNVTFDGLAGLWSNCLDEGKGGSTGLRILSNCINCTQLTHTAHTFIHIA